jgi:hypothetical protein
MGDLRRAFASSLDATQCDRESLRSASRRAGLRLISQRCPARVALGAPARRRVRALMRSGDVVAYSTLTEGRVRRRLRRSRKPLFSARNSEHRPGRSADVRPSPMIRWWQLCDSDHRQAGRSLTRLSHARGALKCWFTKITSASRTLASQRNGHSLTSYGVKAY